MTNPRSHSSLASRFLAEFCDEADLLNMVQFHDEHYAVYRRAKPDGSFDEERLGNLLLKIRDWDTFLAFIIVDGCTRGKSSTPVEWLMSKALGLIPSRIDDSWIIRH
ncbi:MAG: hypothetical protein ACKO85_08315 [Isosphaeraceae bacterium]